MLGIGIDIIENVRIEKSLNEKFLNKLLTDDEIKIYNKKIGKKKIEFVCGRFSAKEAIIKCLSDYENPNFKELNILNDNNGKPIIKYKNYNILLSISHETNYAVSIAILIK